LALIYRTDAQPRKTNPIGKRSSAAVINTFRVSRVILTNAESYDRRIQAALNLQAGKMRRQAEFLLTRALKRAGWK